MTTVLIILIVLLLMMLSAVTGAVIGYMTHKKPAVQDDRLSKEEMEMVRQVINLLSFTGEPQKGALYEDQERAA